MNLTLFCNSLHYLTHLEYMYRIYCMNTSKIQDMFSYHTPNQEAINIMNSFREQCKQLALFIEENSSDTEESKQAIAQISTACMWFNAGIARNGTKN